MSSVPVNSVLSVSALTELLRETIEPAFAQVWVTGEVSNFKRQDSGHCYFSLKDEGAQLPVVLFRQNALRLQMPVRDGMKVSAFGRIAIYAPRGAYQLVCQFVVPAGQGSLAERFEMLKRKLEAEGLFAQERKLPLPTLPRSIGIITSPTGSVLRDFLSILKRRGWKGRVVVLPARVQGAGAAAEIAAMVKLGGKCGLFDLLVIARGGGSLEDLWPFNEEVVARAVAECPIPTISGVGHETDFTLCDFAASRRAETPSAAAELISSLRMDAEDRVQGAADDVQSLADAFLERARARVNLAAARLGAVGPERQIEHAQLRLDELSGRISSVVQSRLRDRRDAVERLASRTAAAGPEHVLSMARQRVEQLALRLESASPGSVLRRGYAIVSRPDGVLITRNAALTSGDKISIRLHDGQSDAVIK